jgi:CheY-like chemotaxis protein
MAVVLVVNDDGDLLDTYEAVLADMGHEPVTKLTIGSGPETVRDVGADALVVDLQATGEDDFGLRIIEEVRNDPELRDLPIILCSGAAESIHPLRDRLAALNVPVVIKPFRIGVLEEQLQEALGSTDSEIPRHARERAGRGMPVSED